MPVVRRIPGLALLFSLALAPAALSQNASPPSPGPPSYSGTSEHMDGAHVPPIPNASFSAKAELESTKTLADGTVVSHHTYNLIARDFRGRTYNEFRIWAAADGSEPKMTRAVLYDPDTHTRTYMYPANHLARLFVTKTVSIVPSSVTQNLQLPTVQKEDLGANFEDGIRLTGTRETKTYPAGSLGNDQPISIVTEYWYSPDLQLNIRVKRTDPRFGVQTVHLTNLRSEEPDASLFEVSADYKIVNETSPMSEQVASGGVGQDGLGRVRQGGNIQAAKLLTRVQPIYPEKARKERISGTVRLHAIIGKDGAIKSLEVMSGHPMLQQASLDAVRQWRYAPTLLMGEPVEVDTTIDVIFNLVTRPDAGS